MGPSGSGKTHICQELLEQVPQYGLPLVFIDAGYSYFNCVESLNGRHMEIACWDGAVERLQAWLNENADSHRILVELEPLLFSSPPETARQRVDLLTARVVEWAAGQTERRGVVIDEAWMIAGAQTAEVLRRLRAEHREADVLLVGQESRDIEQMPLDYIITA